VLCNLLKVVVFWQTSQNQFDWQSIKCPDRKPESLAKSNIIIQVCPFWRSLAGGLDNQLIQVSFGGRNKVGDKQVLQKKLVYTFSLSSLAWKWRDFRIQASLLYDLKALNEMNWSYLYLVWYIFSSKSSFFKHMSKLEEFLALGNLMGKNICL